MTAVGALLVAGGAAQTDVVRVPQVVLAPAYDVGTQASLRNLTTALQSYALLEGDLDAVTVEDLADWGWTPQETTAVTIWVEGSAFRVAARDVRPGAGTFAAEADDGTGPTLGRADAWSDATPASAGTRIVVGLPAGP